MATTRCFPLVWNLVLTASVDDQGLLSKLVDEADSKSAAADPASRFESGEGHFAVLRPSALDDAAGHTVAGVARGVALQIVRSRVKHYGGASCLE